MHAIELGLDRAERPAVFDGRIHLRVKRLLMRHAAGEINLDDGLGLAFLAGLDGGGGIGLRLQPKRITQRQPEAAQSADK